MDFAEYLAERMRKMIDGGRAIMEKVPSTRRVPAPPGGRSGDSSKVVEAILEAGRKSKKSYYEIELRDMEPGKSLLAADGPTQASVALELVFRLWQSGEASSTKAWYYERALGGLLRRDLPLGVEGVEYLLLAVTEPQNALHNSYGGALRQVQAFLDGGGSLTGPMRLGLGQLRETVGQGGMAEWRKMAAVIAEILGEEGHAFPDPGEPWSDAALADVRALSQPAQAAWREVFAHILTADGPAKPPAKWQKEAVRLAAAVDAAGGGFADSLARWLSLVVLPPLEERQRYPEDPDWTETVPKTTEKNVSLLKGLAWFAAQRPEAAVARGLGRLAEVGMRKVPGTGAWAQRAATAAVWALGESPCPEAVAHLGRARLKIAHRPTQALIDRTIEAAAKRSGISKEQLEDLAVPTYGLDDAGVRREEFDGGHAAELRLSPGGDVSLGWSAPDGKPLKSVPAALKQGASAATVKGMKADADAAEKMLAAQRARFDGFLIAGRVWELSAWRAAYLAHPLLGNVARRLIWHVRTANGEYKDNGLWDDLAGTFVNADGAKVEWAADEATELLLWHPIGFPADYTARWREELERRGIRQPFKQAHREVYLLTDAELNTGTYSNRFAGHLLKQHQFHTLAQLRGWRYNLAGGWDGSWDEPATLALPRFGLRAEFWVEAADAGGDDAYTDSGIHRYLSTDQVRFYRGDDKDPLPLSEVPALAFSEVMRDVDLFVGVSSVGNDPNWRDGGADRYHAYWSDFAFGDLSASAQTRAEVLGRLLPRLKIAARCRIDGKFLTVRGDLRTYKIHLGSGNILMEPNDEYLCIVQDRKQGGEDGLHLPFEGDQRLALILSKAFLLADDTKITDRTILSQIRRR